MCTISNRNGALAVAAIQFISALLTLIWLCSGHPYIRFDEGLIVIVLIFNIINFFIPFVLVYGVLWNRSSFVQAILAWEGICLVYFMIFLVTIALHQFEWEVGQEIFVLHGILFFVHCAFLYVLYNYCEAVRLQKYECRT